MHVTITGGAGFLGLRLARRLLENGLRNTDGRQHPVTRLILADRAAAADLADPRTKTMVGDIADPEFVESIIGTDTDVVFHLAAVVSGQAEADFDLGMRVNVDASRLVLQRCRQLARPPRLVFTSSVAVFGPAESDRPLIVDPLSSYGMEKAVAELMLKDYSRRGFVDGIVLRLPTISVRPGAPNKAASSFASGIVREPLSGLPADCPVDPSTILWLLSPRSAILNLVHAAELPADQLAGGRVINLPGVSVTVADMIAAVTRAGGEKAATLIRHQHDAAVERIVANWPPSWDDTAARALGFVGDQDFDAMVRAYIEDDLSPSLAAPVISMAAG